MKTLEISNKVQLNRRSIFQLDKTENSSKQENNPKNSKSLLEQAYEKLVAISMA